MSNANLIDPQAFAEHGQQQGGRFRLHDLDKRLSEHEYLADIPGGIGYALQGGKDRLQRIFLDLSVKARLQLYCQRCLQPMPFLIDENTRIVLFADEEKLDEAMLCDEELDGMIMSDTLDVRELVEDQILMAIPLSPRHEVCSGGECVGGGQDRPNPFAVLSGLKSTT